VSNDYEALFKSAKDIPVLSTGMGMDNTREHLSYKGTFFFTYPYESVSGGPSSKVGIKLRVRLDGVNKRVDEGELGDGASAEVRNSRK
jgi:hypothetical protein